MGSKLMTNLTNFFATGVALWITSSLFDGFSFETIESLVLCSILLTLINIFVKPIVFLLALPLAIFTLGLIIPIINGAFLLLLAEMIPNFTISSFYLAIFAALLTSLVSTLIFLAIGRNKSSIYFKTNSKFSEGRQDFGSRYTSELNDKKTIDVKVKEKK